MSALVPAASSVFARLARWFFWVLCASLLACVDPEAAELLELSDVAPRRLEIGDRVEVMGRGLPSGSVNAVEVSFHGTLYRPGQTPETLDDWRIAHATPDPDHVAFVVDEALQRAFCGDDDAAVHTTFEGDVVVRYPPAVAGSAGVSGRLEGVVLDIPGPLPRREWLETAQARGQRLAHHLGLELGPPPERPDRLAVVSVRPASEAARAGVEVGDLVVRFAGVTVLGAEDMMPPPERDDVALAVARGAETRTFTLSVAAFERPLVPRDALGGLVVLSILFAFFGLYASPLARPLAWLERRLMLRLATERAPTRKGLRTAVATLVRRLKEQLQRQGWGPYLVFAAVTASFVLMPLGGRLFAADLDVGVLYVLSFCSLVGIGLVTAQGSKGRWTPLAALRAAAQLFVAQLPAIAAVVSVVLMTGSLRVVDVISAQCGDARAFVTTGAWPWHWFVFRHPGTMLLFGALFVTAGLEGHRGALSLDAAEGSPDKSRPSLRPLLFVFVDWANVFILCGLAAGLFLGGWQLPGITPQDQAEHRGLQAAGVALFVLKAWTLILGTAALRRALPRLQLPQLTRLAWRVLIPVSTLAALSCAGWWHLTRPEAPTLPVTVQHGIGAATFGFVALVVGHFGTRLLNSWRHARPSLQVNPFL
ncbi:MAG: NADH-quinone oxidoreductase subunit H [Myxococcota bacterium]